MDCVHRQTLDLAAGCVTAFMSRLDQALGRTSLGTSDGLTAAAKLDNPFSDTRRVLVVDDDPLDVGCACELLGYWGITPTLAADGAKAVALACGGGFDLILMDLQMPVLDGLAATKQIRLYEHQHLCVRAPVLAYTSCVLDDDVLRDCGVDGVLAKPCSASSLQECLLR
jgi:CheY-like chemotaxis protein